MQYVTVAFRAEARPLIESWRLTLDSSVKEYSVYRSRKPDRTLIITGMGKDSAAQATRFILSKAIPQDTLLNIGLAGCRHTDTIIGTVFSVKIVIDAEHQRCYTIGKISTKKDSPEAVLETHIHPVESPERMSPEADLVDMEASGCIEAAKEKLPLSSIYCLKIVSDHLNTNQFHTQNIPALMRPLIQHI